MVEEIPCIGGHLATSIPDFITSRFIGYGNMPNLVPENHGLYLGVSIASTPEINLPSFQLCFGDKFSGETGNLIFVCANYCPLDSLQSLANFVCLDETAFKKWLVTPNDQKVPPQANEWCIIPFFEFMANEPSLPITEGNCFENIMTFQAALSICIEQLVAMKATKDTPTSSNIFLIKGSGGKDGGEDCDTVVEVDKTDENSNDEGEDSDGTEGGTGDNPARVLIDLTQAQASKSKRKSDQQPTRSSSRIVVKVDDNPDIFKMPAAPVLANGKQKGAKGRGIGGGKKSSQNKKTPAGGSGRKITPTLNVTLKEPPKQRPRKGDIKWDAAITPTLNDSSNAGENYTTPINKQAQQQIMSKSGGGSDHEFSTYMNRQYISLDYNTSVANSMLGFVERMNQIM